MLEELHCLSAHWQQASLQRAGCTVLCEAVRLWCRLAPAAESSLAFSVFFIFDDFRSSPSSTERRGQSGKTKSQDAGRHKSQDAREAEPEPESESAEPDAERQSRTY